jgi:hypothetical protein
MTADEQDMNAVNTQKSKQSSDALFDVKTGEHGETSRIGLQQIRSMLLSGQLKTSDYARPCEESDTGTASQKASTDKPDDKWLRVDQFAKQHFMLDVLLHPVAAHRRHGGRIGFGVVGLIAGIVASFFFLREWHRFGYLPSGLAGWLGVAIVFVVGVVITASLNLVPKAGKALSWVAGILVVLILAGMTSAASLLLPVAFGAGFLVAGFLYGWIPGTIIGLVVGLIRSPRIETVDRTENQKED